MVALQRDPLGCAPWMARNKGASSAKIFVAAQGATKPVAPVRRRECSLNFAETPPQPSCLCGESVGFIQQVFHESFIAQLPCPLLVAFIGLARVDLLARCGLHAFLGNIVGAPVEHLDEMQSE